MIYIIKQDIRIYVPYSRPNGWTDWAEIFCVHSRVAMGVTKAKKNRKEKFPTFFFPWAYQALQLVTNKGHSCGFLKLGLGAINREQSIRNLHRINDYIIRKMY